MQNHSLKQDLMSCRLTLSRGKSVDSVSIEVLECNRLRTFCEILGR